MNDTEALNAAYRERAQLVALLAALYPSHIGHNDPNEPEWAVVTVELPTGQACWHVAPDDMPLFSHVQPTTRICRGWDGHTTEEKYERIRGLIDEIEDGRESRVPLPALTGTVRTCACGAPAALSVGYYGERVSVLQCVRCATEDPRRPFFHRDLAPDSWPLPPSATEGPADDAA